MLTVKKLKWYLDYNPATGEWKWLAPLCHRLKTGDPAGCVRKHGYHCIDVEGRRYYSHQLAWLYMTGKWPKAEVDHINLDKADNRWSNLREATHGQNGANTLKRSDNISGFKGVSWHAQRSKWQVFCSDKYVGIFNSLEEAHAAYVRAAEARYGEFARAG